MMFFGRLFLAVAVLSTLAVAQSDDDYSHLLECLTQGSGSSTKCGEIKDCMWCPSASKSCCSKEGICVSSAASSSFMGDSHYQCNSPSSDDDVAPHSDDDYFPPDDDATFDDDKAVDDDAATTDDDAATTDDDANNDDIDTDDYNPYDDDQATTDDDANTDDDNTDEYMRKLLECLAIGNSTGCARNTPAECVWCTTSFGEGLCVSDEAGKDIDGYFYTCQWNATTTAGSLFDEGEESTKDKEESSVDSSVYDHYCWNAHDQEACEDEVDGRDLPCVWCPGLVGEEDDGMCLSMAQTDLVEQCQVEKQE